MTKLDKLLSQLFSSAFLQHTTDLIEHLICVKKSVPNRQVEGIFSKNPE